MNKLCIIYLQVIGLYGNHGGLSSLSIKSNLKEKNYG